MNDFIIILILILAGIAALYSCIRKHTKGGCPCGGDCGCDCHTCPKNRSQK